jgi:hypothetical protein
MTPEQRALNAQARAQAMISGTYQPKARKPAGEFSSAKSALVKRMRSGRKNATGTAKFDMASLATIADALQQMGFGIYDLESGMGFFDDLWSGVKDVGKTALQVAPHLLPFIM